MIAALKLLIKIKTTTKQEQQQTSNFNNNKIFDETRKEIHLLTRRVAASSCK
jgi:hypothetical protein